MACPVKVSNAHKVPKRQWAKWNSDERAAFNRMWSAFPVPCKELVLAPGRKLTFKEQQTLRWNVCWLVADMLKQWRGFWGFAK